MEFLRKLQANWRELYWQWRYPKLGVLRQYAPVPIKWPRQKTFSVNHFPKISVVVPTFNSERYLTDTMRSLEQQNYPSLEIVIQDGGSTDATLAIIDSFSHVISSVVSSVDRGQAHALNRGFRRTSGDILAYLNSDDLLLPNALHRIAEWFNRHSEIDVIYGHRLLIDEHSRDIGRWILPPHVDDAFLWQDFIPQETMFWRRELWEKIGGQFDEALQFAMDWDLILRFHGAKARFLRLNAFLGAFRVHEHQKTSTLLNSVGLREIEALRRRVHKKTITPEQLCCKVRYYLLRHFCYDRLHALGLHLP